MPKTKVVLYRERNGTVPLLEWLETLDSKARAKCRVRLGRLADGGHELRRPEADYLRDGIHELRVKHHGVNYRIFYFFHERAAVVTHGMMKQRASVPPREIEMAVSRRGDYLRAPWIHTHEE